jgi:Fe-S cluster assembly iron-binding protein IscA
MLQVTDAAVSVFKELLGPAGAGQAIRIEPVEGPGGETAISFSTIPEPREGDAPSQARDLEIYVAPELAPGLEDAVLDARTTEAGPELFLRLAGPEE